MGAEDQRKEPNIQDNVKPDDFNARKKSPFPAPDLPDNKDESHPPTFKSRKQETVVATGKRGQGIRRSRRLENTNFLLSLMDNEEYGNEESFSEFVPCTTSSFDQLFLDHESMEIWNDFINQTEEDQERYLEQLEDLGAPKGTQAKVDKEQNEKEDTSKDDEEVEEIDGEDFILLGHTDHRADHPAHSPKECYARINSGLRTFLKRRCFSKGSLEDHEEELTAWFSEDAQSVWISQLPNGFERLLLHAVSQYLDLRSESYDCDGQRQTKVENNNMSFHPPNMCLSKYLDSVRL